MRHHQLLNRAFLFGSVESFYGRRGRIDPESVPGD